MRTDLYKLVHKSQRHFLFESALQLGRANLDDGATRTRMVQLVREIIHMLRDHSHNEETYIHPLFVDTAPDHHALDVQLAALEQVIADGGELYPAVMRLIGDYLIHQDDEERMQVTHLWPRYTDEELRAVFKRFHEERDPAIARADFLRMIPALNPQELARVIKQ